MKQVLQSLKSGVTEVADVPAPGSGAGAVLISTKRTLISAGTERTLVGFAKANLAEKARLQPERVSMAFEKIQTDGILPTIAAVKHKLDQPLALGYCNVGRVIGVGAGVLGIAVGDRIASNGKHAEIVSVPANLCARVPDQVSDDEAVFTVLGAIALQGIRLAQPTLGEVVVVTGLGLVGLLTVQLLRAQGCRVLGLDFDADKLALAAAFGAEIVNLSRGDDPVRAAVEFSRGRGVDAVILTASTKSSEPLHQAALMSRQRGRIVLVGVVGLELARDDFYRKELTFQVSSSYGPGRYDPNYEERGQDYPPGFVRWTAQRNFEAVLDMMADSRLNVDRLISHRFRIEAASDAYDLVTSSAPSLGVVLEYAAHDTPASRSVVVSERSRQELQNALAVSFVGAGNYATAVLIPAFRAAGARLQAVASMNGVSGLHAARKFGFASTSTDTDAVIADKSIGAVVVTTRHDSHARLVRQALIAGKSVFVEKPLCLTLAELSEIESLHAALTERGSSPRLMVGFNRRFAPHIMKISALLACVHEPKAFVMTVNAGSLPGDHWTHDQTMGGGRIVGEGCHFIDLLRYLARSAIVGHECVAMRSTTHDTASLQLSFADGSIGTVHYLANGSKAFPKERLDVFAGGRVLHLDNFRTLSGYGWPGFKSMNLWRQDKGQNACAAAFMNSLRDNAASPIPLEELLEVARVTIAMAKTL